jgi:hypothetical protein
VKTIAQEEPRFMASPAPTTASGLTNGSDSDEDDDSETKSYKRVKAEFEKKEMEYMVKLAALSRQKEELQRTVEKATHDIRSKELTSNHANPLYVSLDERSRRILESKDLYITSLQEKIKEAKAKSRELASNPLVQKIISQHKEDRPVLELFT